MGLLRLTILFFLAFTLSVGVPASSVFAGTLNHQEVACLLDKFRAKVYSPRDPELERLTNTFKVNLREILLKSPEESQRWNQNVLQALQDIPMPSNPRRIPAISYRQARAILIAVKEHPVASFEQLERYDPDGSYGFCFGRAMTVHLEANAVGVDQSSMRKLFMVGSLSSLSDGTSWGYHVATVIRATDGGWWAIDPIFGTPMKAASWLKAMQKEYDPDKKAQIYSSPAYQLDANAEAGSPKYRPDVLKRDYFREYFRNLIQSFKDRDQRPFSSF